jgi:hypothetical protein
VFFYLQLKYFESLIHKELCCASPCRQQPGRPFAARTDNYSTIKPASRIYRCNGAWQTIFGKSAFAALHIRLD